MADSKPTSDREPASELTNMSTEASNVYRPIHDPSDCTHPPHTMNKSPLTKASTVLEQGPDFTDQPAPQTPVHLITSNSASPIHSRPRPYTVTASRALDQRRPPPPNPARNRVQEDRHQVLTMYQRRHGRFPQNEDAHQGEGASTERTAQKSYMSLCGVSGLEC
jgi:hypothetical protein